MIFNWSLGTAIAAALAIASLCVVAAGLEATRRERLAQRGLQQLAGALKMELLSVARQGVLEELVHLTTKARESIDRLIRVAQARKYRLDVSDVDVRDVSSYRQTLSDAARPVQNIVRGAERIPVEVILISDDANTVVSALFTAADRLHTSNIAIEQVDRAFTQGSGPDQEPPIVEDIVAALFAAHATIEQTAGSIEALAEAISPHS